MEATATRVVTAEELLHDHPDQPCELVEGRIRLMSPSALPLRMETRDHSRNLSRKRTLLGHEALGCVVRAASLLREAA